MRRLIGLIVTLALGIAPLTAQAGSAGADRAATRAEIAGHLAKRITGLDPQFAKAAALSADFAFLTRGADFDGDGVEEVVDSRVHVSEDATTGDIVETLRLDARRGTDGKLLWSKTVGSASYVFPVFAKVGAGGGMGVVVVAYDGTYSWTEAGGGGVESTTVTTFDGKGNQVWTQAFHGTGGYSDAGGGVTTYFEGVMDANPGGGSEALLSNIPFGYAYDPVGLYPGVNQVTPVILDGATGQPRPLTPVLTTSAAAWATPVPDLNKDGREDVVVAGAVGAVTTVVALKSSDGTVLWANRDVPAARVYIPRSMGDATGDGVADVAVSALSSALPIAETDDQVSLVDGAKGTLLWTKKGTAALALGTADRKAGADIAVGDWVLDGDSMGFQMTAYNGAGTALWSAKRTMDLSGNDGYIASGSWGAIGDTDGDGASEIGYALKMTGTSTSYNDAGTIDGRTGRVRRDPVTGMYASRLAFDGRGTDGYRIDAKKKNVLHATTFRGDDNKMLWDVTVPVKGTVSTNGTPLYAGADDCADLAVNVQNGTTTTTYVLSGATGRPVWALSRAGTAAGTVTHPRARSAKAFSKGC